MGKRKVLKAKEKQPNTKEATIDQRRGQFPFWSSIKKAGKSRKAVIRKNSNNGPKEGTISLLEFSHKSRKEKKSCHKEKYQLWVKESVVSKWDEGYKNENIFEDSNLLKFSRRVHSWLGLGFYVDDFLSHVTYTC